MYTQHFNLSEPPFSIAPNPRYLFLSPQHREALAHLLYGLGVGGFVALTGEVGTGKTTLCRCLLEQLPEDVDIALIFNPRLSSRELLASLCDELHISNPGPRASLKQLIDVLNHHLLDAHARGRRTIVLIDEAQNLSFDVLEQIRLLTNLETNQAKLLQIILVGQPELNTLLARPNLRQLSQRITARYHLKPLSLGATRDYIRHRLAVAGGRERTFTELAVRAIFRKTSGIPRLINLVADRALLGAYSLGRGRVNWRVARKAARELLPTTRSKFSWGWVSIVLLGAAGAAVHFVGMPGGTGLGRGESTVLAENSGTKPTSVSRAAAMAEQQSESATLAGRVPVGSGEFRPPGTLAASLAGPDLTRESAFSHLFLLWRLPPPGDRGDACAFAARHGLRCVTMRVPWLQLRSLNHPAVLEFVMPNGNKRYATLIKVRNGNVELALGETSEVFDLEELLSLWKGGAVIIFRPPENSGMPITPGRRSETVRWVRDRLGGAAEPGLEDFFDPALKTRVMAFQAERGLSADGVVGALTMIYLGLKGNDAGDPRLEPALP